VIIDGFQGIFWKQVRQDLDTELRSLGITAAWTDVSGALLPEKTIDALIEPFLGGDDPIFGTRFTGELIDFFDAEKLTSLSLTRRRSSTSSMAAARRWPAGKGTLVYVDLPKNELQFRARAGSVTNLGVSNPSAPKPMYKRFYFVDWIALNQHKAGCCRRSTSSSTGSGLANRPG
jgi:hypothetical protein